MAKNGFVFNMQSFSVQDGPGVRTTVFFSGCNLRCAWCHNPESRRTNALKFNPDVCIGCGACFEQCPHEAHRWEKEGHILDRSKCAACGRCAEFCYAGALELVGKEISTDALMENILADKAYFKNSGGGVTFSGGECMLQIDFLQEILRLCKENELHTAVDTAGCVPYGDFRKISPYTDLFLYDIKAMEPETSMRYIGADGGLIRRNLEKLLSDGANVVVRIPCVAGANVSDLPEIARWMNNLPVRAIELLPYHRLGEGKFALLGREAERFDAPTDEEMEEYAGLFRKADRTVKFTKQA